MLTKDLLQILRNIDASLMILANASAGGATTAFVSKKTVASRLGVQPVVIDKLVYQGITSKGESGLVEGRHYCKLDPAETNISNFLFDSAKVLSDAWTSFSGYCNG
jgi:hypothetical protein